ncbi:beta-propeller domain-containing protein, methanol dehydrogenase [Synechococcus sp. PCC 7502]|uniref:TPM domain-containing protein n=1 Tax=Synechococcus sp. PCC 7502 TaxID=1173263 RepID=UPI00029FD072|nr:TPM domain-containing protein [Synechococcus sp. PCC 7502]AFY72935.1 beta-propeller domain-containing protein, methanol dehydrogenase [Synechococcus sp. PCC 7502]
MFNFLHRYLALAIACLAVLIITLSSPNSSYAIDAPELLPQQMTNVIDLGKFLSDFQETKLNKDITEFEAKTGWKLRVLTQVDLTPGRAVKDFWDLNERSVLLVADSRDRNLLNFNVGDEVYSLLPRGFWIELQSRYGNQFFVREQGQDQAILASLAAITTCLAQDGCNVVPGLPQEQWVLTLLTSILGGLIFGFAGQPRREGETFALRWALILTPLWGMLFVAFGIAPVISRTADWLPITRNVAGFIGGAIIAYLIPITRRSTPPKAP